MFMSERFPTNWFPYGATLVSTMTRFAHPGQPLDEWTRENARDLERMAEHGMTAVSIMMDWELTEPQEGNFDFRHHDPILEKAEKLGLKIVLWPWEQVGPEWIPRNHPDWLWEADDGSRPPFGCWHHPAFQDRVSGFLTRVVERYRDNPAVMMWNVAIEPHYRITGWSECMDERGKIYCYQPATLEKFRRWLQQRNENDLDRLNRRWVSQYTSWDQVEPPRRSYYLFNSPRFYDWRMFWIAALAEYQHSKSDLVHTLDAKHPTTGNSGWYPSPIHAGLGLHKIAAGFDSFGISLFPVYRWGRIAQVSNNLSYTFVRSACHPDKPAFVHELQGGPTAHGAVFGETPRPEEIRQWSWQAVGNDYKGVFFWAWRHHRTSTEMGGFGLCNMDGSVTSRTVTAGETSRELQKAAPLIQRVSRVPPKVAILYSDLNLIVNQIAGKLSDDPQVGSLHSSGFEGYFETLFKLRIPTHHMIQEQLKELIDGNLSHIKALIIPYLPMMTAQDLIILDKFVNRGGLIWADPWLAQRDDANSGRMVVPGDILQTVFGCVQGEVRPILRDNPQNRKNLWRGSSLIGNGTCRVKLPGMVSVELKSLVHEVSLEPLAGTEVLGVFENGAPGLIRKRYGRSAVYYTGSYFGITARQEFVAKGFDEQHSQETAASTAGPLETGLKTLFKQILAEQGIFPGVEIVGEDQPEMETHLLTGNREALAIFLNFSPHRLYGTWRLRPEFEIGEKTRATDLTTNQAVAIVAGTAGDIEIKIDLPKYGVAAVRIGEDRK
jgi:beta-galactosidase GanA